MSCSKSHQYKVRQTYQNDLKKSTFRGSAFSDKQNDHLKLSWFPCKLECTLPFGGYIPVWDVFKILSALHDTIIWFEFPIHSSTSRSISQPLLIWPSIFKDLGKLQYFTNLNLVAIKGDEFPIIHHDSRLRERPPPSPAADHASASRGETRPDRPRARSWRVANKAEPRRQPNMMVI